MFQIEQIMSNGGRTKLPKIRPTNGVTADELIWTNAEYGKNNSYKMESKHT
jgi:hypothetical protein